MPPGALPARRKSHQPPSRMLPSMAKGELLENADDNLCFGCGPENPMGLRLEFRREGDTVTTGCTPTPWWSGQPGVVNPGITYAILIDLIIWHASAVAHRVPLFPKTVDMKLGDLRTEVPLTGVARLVKRDGPLLQIRAEIMQEGETRAWLELECRCVSREAYKKARPFVEVPPSLAGFFEGEAP